MLKAVPQKNSYVFFFVCFCFNFFFVIIFVELCIHASHLFIGKNYFTFFNYLLDASEKDSLPRDDRFLRMICGLLLHLLFSVSLTEIEFSLLFSSLPCGAGSN